MKPYPDIENELQVLCSEYGEMLGVTPHHLAAISQRIYHSFENKGKIIFIADESLYRLPELMANHVRSFSGFPVNAGPIVGVAPVPNERFIEFTVGSAGNVNDVCLAIAGPSLSNEFIHVLKTAHEKRIATALFVSTPAPHLHFSIKTIPVSNEDGMDIWGMQFAHFFAHFVRHVFPNGAEDIHQMELGWERAIEKSKSISLKRRAENINVSIVLPTRNRFNTVKRCIENVIANTSTSYEVLVMDDSSDGGNEQLQQCFESFDHIHILHNEKKLGLLPSVNFGVALSIGEYVVGLTDDLDVSHDWDSFMIRLLESEPKCGAVTPLILEADGTIQSMGVIDGVRSWRYPELPTVYGAKGWIGRGRTPEQCPETRWVRECDYGCLSFMRRELMAQLRGYDLRFEKYCADTDLGMRLRLRGYKVLYCPNSVMIHHQLSREAQDATDIQIKKDQKVFHEKWGIYTVPQ